MLTSLAIRNYQSLKSVDLELGTFTVIVGPSSSGKSALMRACRAVASNVRGGAIITRGQKLAAITARTETHIVTLERSETSGSYRVGDGQGSELAFTKLNGGVPELVTKTLRIEPVPVSGTSINFASQFDKPYLLDDSGANVARILGELTNVNTLFEAVRTANKVRLSATAKLRTRKEDLDGLKTRLAEFSGLSEKLRLLQEAEKLNEQAEATRSRIGRLETALRTLQIAERALAKATLPEVPSPEPLNTALNKLLDLKGKVAAMAAKLDRLDTAETELLAHANDADHYEQVLRDKLAEAGVCPTCGQTTSPASR